MAGFIPKSPADILPVLGAIAGNFVLPGAGAVIGGSLAGLGKSAIKGDSLGFGAATGGIGGAGQIVGSNLLGEFFGNQLGKVLPDLPVEGVVGPPSFDPTTVSLLDPVPSSQGLDLLGGGVSDPTGFLASPLGGEALLNPAQSTGLLGISSNQIGRGVASLVGGGIAGTVANQLFQGGGPPPVAPPKLPANIGPRPAAPPDLQKFVVKTGGGLPNTLEELLRRR